jgi:putative ABC transport system permease protein
VNLYVPLRFLRGSWAKLALSIAALACAVALICAIDIGNRAVFRAFSDAIDAVGGQASIQITAGRDGLFDEQGIVAELEKVEGVKKAALVLREFVLTTDGEAITVQALDFQDQETVQVYDRRSRRELGIPDDFSVMGTIILEKSFADARTLKDGGTIELITARGRKGFAVKTLVDFGGLAKVYGGRLGLMDLRQAQEAFDRPGLVTQVDVVVDRDADVAVVRRGIVEAFANAPRLSVLNVESPMQKREDLRNTIRSLQIALHLVGLMGLASAFLIAFNRMAAVFEGRAWQLAVLRAVGLRGKILARELLKESLLVGAAGVAFGIPLGILLGRGLIRSIAQTISVGYHLPLVETEFGVDLPSLLLAAGLGLGAPVLAAIAPALRAARLPICETLRSRGVAQPEVGVISMWGPRLTVLVLIVVVALLQYLTASPVWGLLACVLIAIAAALLAHPLVQSLSVVIGETLSFLAGPSGTFAAANVVRDSRRSGLTIAVIGVGLGSVFCLRIVAQSFERSVIEAVTQVVRADLVVTSSDLGAGYVEASMPRKVMKVLEGVPGVTKVAGVRVVDWRHGEGQIGINAHDDAYFENKEFGEWPLLEASSGDPWKAVKLGRAVLVSMNFASNYGVRAGDVITLQTPGIRKKVAVAGITMDFYGSAGTIEMSHGFYSKYWNDDQVTRAYVMIADDHHAGDVATEIRNALTAYGIRPRILSAGGLRDFFVKQVHSAFKPVEYLAGMFLLVVLVGTADTLVAGMVERTREMGIIRAVGVRRRFLRREVLLEGLTLAVLGLLLGVVAGFSAGLLWVHGTLPYLLGWVVQFHIPWREVGLFAIATTAVCLLAGLFAGTRAARLQPVAALRYE